MNSFPPGACASKRLAQKASRFDAKYACSLWQPVQPPCHLLTICLQGIASSGGDLYQRVGNLFYEFLVDLQILRGFQFTEMRGEIALGKSCLAHEEENARAFDERENCQNVAPRSFML